MQIDDKGKRFFESVKAFSGEWVRLEFEGGKLSAYYGDEKAVGIEEIKSIIEARKIFTLVSLDVLGIVLKEIGRPFLKSCFEGFRLAGLRRVAFSEPNEDGSQIICNLSYPLYNSAVIHSRYRLLIQCNIQEEKKEKGEKAADRGVGSYKNKRK